MSRWLRIALVVLGAGVLLVLIAGTDTRGMLRALAGANRRLLEVAVLFLLVNIGLKALRWQIMVAQLSPRRLSFFAAAAAIIAGVAAGSLVPARGVELAKPLLLRTSHGVALSASTGTVVVERMLDGIALVVLFAGALIALPVARASQFHPAFIAVGLFLAGIAVLMVAPARTGALVTHLVGRLPLPPEVRARTEHIAVRFFQSLEIWRRPGQVWLVLVLSVLAAVVEVMRLAIVFAAVGVPVPFAGAMLVFSVANLVGILSLIPGGVGITELSMAGITRFITAGQFASSAITAAVLVDRALSYYLVAVAGSLILLGTSTRTFPEPPAKGEGSRRIR